MRKISLVLSALTLMVTFSLSAEEGKLTPTNGDKPATTGEKPVQPEVVPPTNNVPKAAPQDVKPQPEVTIVQKEIAWMTNFKDAVAMAKKDNKPLFLFFTGSDWCGWCKKMESEVFSSADFAKKAGHRFVFVMLDYPMNKQLSPEVKKQNQELKQRFGVSGYPSVIILDPNENFIAETGYRPGGGSAYADYILGLLP